MVIMVHIFSLFFFCKIFFLKLHFILGMVVKEEYEYAAFKCAYCNAFNPSKKVRPTAPRLTSQSSETPAIKSESSTSSSEKDSGEFFFFIIDC